jgi:hypothetical protein
MADSMVISLWSVRKKSITVSQQIPELHHYRQKGNENKECRSQDGTHSLFRSVPSSSIIPYFVFFESASFYSTLAYFKFLAPIPPLLLRCNLRYFISSV